MSSPPAGTPALVLKGLTRVFRVHERGKGVASAVKSLIRRQWRNLTAVDGVSFEVPQGKIVGFLGPNGAGKTTTIKMASGLLYPTAGEVRVLGYTPWRRQHEFLQRISLVMGRRNQLIWDIPALDSFEFFRAMYSVPRREYTQILDEMTALLDLGPLLRKPVRVLSMGERMKCELTAALLHKPQMLFLDEPTIGLDIVSQHNFRQFIAEYNRRYGATILLTSHYMGDVEALCEKVIFIQSGRLVFSGNLKDMVQQMLPYKELSITFTRDVPAHDLNRFGTVVASTGRSVTLRIPKAAAVRILPDLMSTLPIEDLSMIDPPASEVVKAVYSGEITAATAISGEAA
jgi:viologen exporter family transport system ATP-binding protein